MAEIMNKLTKVRIRDTSTATPTISGEIPIGANARDVVYKGSYNLEEVLGDIDLSNGGSIATQIQGIIERFENEIETLKTFNKEGTISGAVVMNDTAANKATVQFSTAQGSETIASGSCSHAEGYQTEAKAAYSHASGYQTIAEGGSQTVIGKCNIADSNNLFIIGNGARNDSRSNACTVSHDGNAWFAGTVKSNTPVTSSSHETQLTTKKYVDNLPVVKHSQHDIITDDIIFNKEIRALRYNADDNYYTKEIRFTSDGFTLTVGVNDIKGEGLKDFSNSFTISRDSQGNITSITNNQSKQTTTITRS